MNIIKGICTDISSEGKGVVKVNNKIYFVDGLFIGEEAELDVQYQRSGVYFAKVKKLINASKNRVQPKCKICTSCGGCQYQQINYNTQLEYKTSRVRNAIKRIGKIDCKVMPCIGATNPYYYRNKIQVPFSKDRKGNVIFGFYKENSHIIMPIKECSIEDRRAAPILWDIKLLLEKHKISTFDEDTGYGLLRYVLIRTSIHFDEIMLVLVTAKMNFPGQRNFIDELIKLHPEITTIVENFNPRHTNVILGEKEKILYGKGIIKEQICGLNFDVSASSFFQVNPTQVEVLYNTAINLLNDDKNQVVLDAYAGVGTIGMIASQKSKKVYSVELNKFAHKNAIENAKRNNIKNMEFACADAGEFISTFDGELDVVIMDPPRKGSDEKFLQTLIDKGIKKVIYISCDPETLSRDLNYLNDYYDVSFVQPVDMFPMTCHCETITLLCLKR